MRDPRSTSQRSRKRLFHSRRSAFETSCSPLRNQKYNERDQEPELTVGAYCQDSWSDTLERNIFRAYEQMPLQQGDYPMPTVLPRSPALMRGNGGRGRREPGSSAFPVFVPLILVLVLALILIGNEQISLTSIATILQAMADTNL